MAAQLTDLIAPSFYEIHHFIKERRYTHYWPYGGRGSTKSSFVSIEFILEILKNPNIHGIALRKHQTNLLSSVYNQLTWAIMQLGLLDHFKFRTSPMTITYKKTGQVIYFRGCDDATKIKSIKPKFGYIGVGWFEELNEFTNMAEVRNVRQSFIRGGDDFTVFYTFNPPRESNNWVNKEIKGESVETTDAEVIEELSSTYKMHSTYLDVPVEWLGKQFIRDAETLKLTKYADYEHEYLGIANGVNEARIVPYWSSENVRRVDYSPELDMHITCDFNIAPNCWAVAHKSTKKAYFFDEFCFDLPTEELIKVVLDKYPHPNRIVINGDASGDFGHSNSGYTDYSLIRNELIRRGYHIEDKNHKTGKIFKFDLRKSNGDRKARFTAWNEKVLDKDGERCIFADPKCKYLILNCEELKAIPGTSNFDIPSVSRIKLEPNLRFLGHAIDNGMYLVNTYWPVMPAYNKKEAELKTKLETFRSQGK